MSTGLSALLQQANSDSRDDVFMETFKAYLQKNNFKNLLWWSWANSPDSGAITLDDKQDNNKIFSSIIGGRSKPYTICTAETLGAVSS